MKRICFVILMVILIGISPVWAKGGAIKEGSAVTLDFVLMVEDQMVESTEGKQPLSYIHGKNMINMGLEKALEGFKAGDEIEASVSPADGYGPVDPRAIVDIPKEQLAEGLIPSVGQVLKLNGDDGRIYRGVVKEIRQNTLLIDFNHPLAGKTLDYFIKIKKLSKIKGKIKNFKRGRICKKFGCKQRLSVYNSEEICNVHRSEYL